MDAKHKDKTLHGMSFLWETINRQSKKIL